MTDFISPMTRMIKINCMLLIFMDFTVLTTKDKEIPRFKDVFILISNSV